LSVVTSDWFTPNVSTRIRALSGLTAGRGRPLTMSLSVLPGSGSTMASIVMDAPELMNPSWRFRHT
jgi:hypothetical protein